MQKRFLFLLSALVLWAAVSYGAPKVLSNPIKEAGYTQTVTVTIGDTSDSDPIPVNGTCGIRYTQAGGDDVTIYSVPTATTAASSGTQIASFDTSTTAPILFRAGTPFIKVVPTDATVGGSIVTVQCSYTQIGGSGGGAPGGSDSGSSFSDDCSFPSVFGCPFGS